jgi:hypothetical protein
MCLKLELLKLLKNFYSLGIKTFLSNLWSQNFEFFLVVYVFPWSCTIVSIFLPTKITKLRKFETKKQMLVEGGGRS